MNKYIVETKKLVKKFKDIKSVNEIDLKIGEGEIYGFLGPNGAGKSTTIKMILGLIKPTSGEIQVFGQSIEKDRENILRNVGALVESPSYYGHLTAYENLDILRRILKLDKNEIIEKLKLVNLYEAKDKKVKEFSLGMKQRLGIAQALMGNPKLLILDEPTNGLDPAGIIEIRNLIKKLAKEKKMTIIISSHILSEIELIVTQVGVINKGKLLYQGSLNELKRHGVNEVMVGIDEEDKEDAYRVLASIGYRVNEEKGKYKVTASRIEASEVCRELVLAGIKVNYLSQEQASLEEIFLGLTMEGQVC